MMMKPVDLERIKWLLSQKWSDLVQQELVEATPALVAEVEALRADLAVARAVLEDLRGYIPAGSDEGDADVVLSYMRLRTKEALSRLGTGEALAVVRGAIRLIDILTQGKHALLARLRAVFGEERSPHDVVSAGMD